MEANHKKLKLLKKNRYSDYFDEAKNSFENSLLHALLLAEPGTAANKALADLQYSYSRHKSGRWDTESSFLIGSAWVSEQVVTQWIDRVSRIKRQNQKEIDLALLDLNAQNRRNAQNGLYGFCISIIVGILGLWFVSGSILSPLKTLTERLKRLSTDKLYKPISLKGGNEFQNLATAYNDMSQRLYEEENIRNEFIATLSHEIRTPLSSIHESVNMVVEEVFGPLNAKQQKFLKIASIEIRRITKLLNHLLDVSALETDSRKKKSTKLDGEKLIYSAFNTFASLAEKKKVSLVVKGCEKPPQLFGIKEEIQQVFVNIIGNAIKYSPQGETVTVSFDKDKRKQSLIFKVSDRGPGIPDDEMSLIFTKYYRTKNVRSHQDGVGLGLAIAHKIISGYGGTILVANNDKQGCTFSFTLPTIKYIPYW
jgi:signal transduction histidine kinase